MTVQEDRQEHSDLMEPTLKHSLASLNKCDVIYIQT